MHQSLSNNKNVSPFSFGMDLAKDLQKELKLETNCDLSQEITPSLSSNEDNNDNNNNNDNDSTTNSNNKAISIFSDCIVEPETYCDECIEPIIEDRIIIKEEPEIIKYDLNETKLAESVESTLLKPFEKQAKKTFCKPGPLSNGKPGHYKRFAPDPGHPNILEIAAAKDFKTVIKQKKISKNWDTINYDINTHFAKENLTKQESDQDYEDKILACYKKKDKSRSSRSSKHSSSRSSKSHRSSRSHRSSKHSSSKSSRSHRSSTHKSSSSSSSSTKLSSSSSSKTSKLTSKSVSKSVSKSSSKSKIITSSSSSNGVLDKTKVAATSKDKVSRRASSSSSSGSRSSKKVSSKPSSKSSSSSTSKSKSKTKIVAKPGNLKSIDAAYGGSAFYDMNNMGMNQQQLMALQYGYDAQNMHINLNMNGAAGHYYYNDFSYNQQQYDYNQCFNNYNMYNPPFNHQQQYQQQYHQIPPNGCFNETQMNYFPINSKPFGMAEIAENVNDSNSVPHSQISYSNSRNEGEDYQLTALN